MGFSVVYKKLIFKGIKKAFRIICIMLILDKVKNPKKSPLGLLSDLGLHLCMDFYPFRHTISMYV